MSQNVKLFGRSYKLTVDTIEITDLDIEFTVARTLKPGEPNKAEVKIYNLNSDHRKQLEGLGAPAVRIEAGYGDSLDCLFTGYLRTGTTVKEGTDFVTTLASADGEDEIRTKRINKTVSKNTHVKDVIRDLVDALGVDKGNLDSAVSDISNQIGTAMFSEGTILRGSAAREMTNICRAAGMLWSIQNGKFQLIAITKALDAEAIELSSDHGLVGSPKVSNAKLLECTCLLIPGIYPGRKLVMNANTVKGQYRIESTTHSGNTAGSDWYVQIEARPY